LAIDAAFTLIIFIAAIFDIYYDYADAAITLMPF
jgi:hypothetical protein